MVRAALAVVVMATVIGLGGCAGEKTVTEEQPAFYLDMAHGGAKLDANVAASMISGYRQNNGLGAVELDPVLMRAAESQAMAMAAHNKMDHEVVGTLPHRLQAVGYDARVAVENISAGYHTLAEAFSGWRDSPPHRANMLASGVTKMGIAASYAPNTKYKVFWALVLAAPSH
jgi:uncharacterized protein YkwD